MIFWLFQAPHTTIIIIKFVSNQIMCKKIGIRQIWKVLNGDQIKFMCIDMERFGPCFLP